MVVQFVDSIPPADLADGFSRYVPMPLNANPFFETDVSNWTGTGGTVARSTAQFQEGVASLLFTPDGVTVNTDARSENVPATVGLSYRASVWVRCAVSRNVGANINWRDAGGILLSTSNLTVAVTADTWTLIDFTAIAPASTAQAQLTASMGSTPLVSHLLYVDGAILTTESNGWGILDGATATMRPRWGFEGGAAANYSVASTGRISITAVNTLYAMLVGVQLVEFDKTVTVTIPVVATGGPIYLGLLAPYASSANNYKAEAVFDVGGALSIRIRRTIDATGTDLASASAGTYTAASAWKLRFQLTGGSTWRAKIWASGGVEPASWTVTATDTPALGFGRPGVSAVAAATNTNTLPLLVEYDDFSCVAAPRVRLDLSDDAPWRTLADGTDLSPPPLRHAVASTLLRDGAAHPAAAYDDRILVLRLLCQASTNDASAAAMLELAREVDRPTNILRWQPEGATHAVYFRIIRSGITSVTETPGSGPNRIVDLRLLAEPFGLGTQQILAPLLVSNDPVSTATNPQRVDIPAVQVLGDVDTPVIVRVDALDVDNQQALFAVRHRSLGGLFYELQVEDGNNQTDATEPGNDPVMSGAGPNYVRVSFATNTTMINRVTFPLFPLSTTHAYRGVYRVFLRYRKSVGTDVIRVRLLWGGTATPGAIFGPTVTLVSSTDRRYADLGLVSIPIGSDPQTDGYSGLPWPATGVTLAIQAERASGTEVLDLDVLVFVPADERLCLVSWPDTLSGFGVVDGVREMAYEQSLDGGSAGPGPIGDSLGIPAAGLFPAFARGVDNRLFVMPNVGTIGAQDSITDSVHVYLTYWPRYLYLSAAT